MKKYLIILSLLLTSIIITYKISSLPEDGMMLISEEKFDQLQDSHTKVKDLNRSFQDFTLNELGHYLEKDAKEQLFLSDGLASKIFLLLLTQLPLNLTPKVKTWTKESAIEKKIRAKEAIPTPSKGIATITIDTGSKNDSTNNIKGIEAVEAIKNSKKEKYLTKELIRLGYTKTPMNFILPNDIAKDLWGKKYYKGKLNEVLLSHTEFYQGDFHGRFFHRSLDRVKVDFNFSLKKGSEDRKVSVLLKMGNQKKEDSFLSINEEFMAYHPVGHNNVGNGSCRGLVLQNENLHIYLMKFPGVRAIVGKVFKKFKKTTKSEIKKVLKPVGAFLLSAKKQKFPPAYLSRIQGFE